MVQAQVNIEILNFAFNFGYNSRPMTHDTLGASFNNLCRFRQELLLLITTAVYEKRRKVTRSYRASI